jgi:hypothetical protein
MSYKFNPFTGNLDEVGAGGGAATPGGSDTQVQFNDGGSFAGDSGLAYNKTTGALTVGGKTVTTNAPILNFSQTWNNAATTFTGLKLNVTNTASAAASNLLDLQIDGTTKFSVSPSAINWPGSNKIFSFTQAFFGSSTSGLNISTQSHQDYTTLIRKNKAYAWSSSDNAYSGIGTALFSDDAGIVAQRNGTNAQTYRLYNTYTDASNYERGFFQWNSNVLEIGAEGAGTGSEKPVRITAATLKLPNLPTYADNTAATSGGLVAGDVYKTAIGELRITV